MALSMSEIEVEKMRFSIINYYNDYLTPESIISNIEEKVIKDKIKKLIILQG